MRLLLYLRFKVVTHRRLSIGYISTWFCDEDLVAYCCCEVDGRRQYIDWGVARKGGRERGSSVLVTGSPGWVGLAANLFEF